MRNIFKILSVISFILLYNCSKNSDKIIIGVYTSDKVPVEFSDDIEFHYLVLKDDKTYYLKYSDLNKEGINGNWELINTKYDTMNIKFNFRDTEIIGKLKDNTFIFKRPNIFDKRMPSFLYT